MFELPLSLQVGGVELEEVSRVLETSQGKDFNPRHRSFLP